MNKIAFVINKDGTPGLPMSLQQATLLISKNKATKACDAPFTIQLNYTQEIKSDKKDAFKIDNNWIIIGILFVTVSAAGHFINTSKINIGTNVGNNVKNTFKINDKSYNYNYNSYLKSMKEHPKIETAIQKYSKKYSVDPDLIRAIIKQESSFNPNAKSHCNASGLMQLMPDTAKGLGVKDIWDIEQNIEGGCKYVSYLKKLFKNNFELTVAGYNAGEGNVQKYNGIPPFEETQDYVKKVTTNYNNYKNGL